LNSIFLKNIDPNEKPSHLNGFKSLTLKRNPKPTGLNN